jgi:hypothetical protein
VPSGWPALSPRLPHPTQVGSLEQQLGQATGERQRAEQRQAELEAEVGGGREGPQRLCGGAFQHLFCLPTAGLPFQELSTPFSMQRLQRRIQGVLNFDV